MDRGGSGRGGGRRRCFPDPADQHRRPAAPRRGLGPDRAGEPSEASGARGRADRGRRALHRRPRCRPAAAVHGGRAVPHLCGRQRAPVARLPAAPGGGGPGSGDVRRPDAPAPDADRGRRRRPVDRGERRSIRGRGGTTTAAPAAGLCNGSAELCGRPLDEVALPATHNAMSSRCPVGTPLEQAGRSPISCTKGSAGCSSTRTTPTSCRMGGCAPTSRRLAAARRGAARRGQPERGRRGAAHHASASGSRARASAACTLPLVLRAWRHAARAGTAGPARLPDRQPGRGHRHHRPGLRHARGFRPAPLACPGSTSWCTAARRQRARGRRCAT